MPAIIEKGGGYGDEMSRLSEEGMSDVAELLAALVRIDSTNPSLREGAPGERAFAEELARRFAALGLEVDLWDVLPGRPNIVARLRGTGGAAAAGAATPAAARSLMFCGHLDVVAAPPSAFQPRVEEGRMAGRGAADMKAGFAAMLLAVESIVRSGRPLAGDLYVAGLIDEEWESAGAAALPARYAPDAAIMAECTGLDVVTGHGGFTWFDVESEGVEAAGADADHGVDGIALLAPVLAGITALDARLAAAPPASYGRGSIHASTIEGGDQYPIYPARCRLGVERCLIAGESVAGSQAEMDALLAAARDADPRFHGAWSMVVGREPVALDETEPVVTAMTAGAAQALGRPPRLRGDIGWMDSGLLVEAGIPCVVFGPSGQGEHTAGEWVDLASVSACARALEAAARAFCG